MFILIISLSMSVLSHGVNVFLTVGHSKKKFKSYCSSIKCASVVAVELFLKNIKTFFFYHHLYPPCPLPPSPPPLNYFSVVCFLFSSDPNKIMAMGR